MFENERKKRRQRTTPVQYSTYVHFLEENPPFFENKNIPNNSDYLKNKWIELADLLNKCQGPTLSVRLWKSVMRSWRCDVRKKFNLLANSSSKILTVPEEKFIELTRRYIGVDSYGVEYLQQSIDDADVDSNDVIECYELQEVDNVKTEVNSIKKADDAAASDDNEELEDSEDTKYSVTVWSEVDNAPIVPSEIPVSCELNEVPENKIDHIAHINNINTNHIDQQKQNGQNIVNEHKEKHRRKRKLSDASLSEKKSSYKSPEPAANETTSIADALNFLASNMSRLADSMSSISHSQWKIAEAQTKLAEAKTKLAEAKLARYKQKK